MLLFRVESKGEGLNMSHLVCLPKRKRQPDMAVFRIDDFDVVLLDL